jgi:hypothetical protein
MKSSGEYGSDSDAWPNDRAVQGRPLVQSELFLILMAVVRSRQSSNGSNQGR